MTHPIEVVEKLPPMHPGEVLREEFLVPLGLTAGKVAKICNVPRTRLERIIAEQVGISGDTAVRLGRAFGTGPELWMYLQSRYDLESAKASIGDAIARISRIERAA